MMVHVASLKEARQLAREIDGTYRKVCEGYLVMDWATARIWDKQR